VAFLRYANARAVSPHLSGQGWDNVRVAAAQTRMDRSLVDQASKILNEQFNPSRYLLSHATIVASVDTVDVPNARLGAATVGGKLVNRKTTAFRIKPECEQYINNNFDSWSRGVLLKSYSTFVGAHNFLEHVQIENLSKGRILDAVARDIGDSVYIDILIATDRKHRELIKDIESGELTTLSMGCSIDGSTCTQCGHWAADETEFCDHIKYLKGDTFYDERGNRCRIAELCGDESLDPTGGVQFIEGSWVKIPAFKGAVRRNLITLSSDDKSKLAKKINKVYSIPAPTAAPDSFLKAARSMKVVAVEDQGLEEDMGADPKPPAPASDPLKEISDEIKRRVLDNVRDSLKEELSKGDLSKSLLPPSDAPNDTLVKQARQIEAARKRVEYVAGISRIVRTASSDLDMVQKIARWNTQWSIFLRESLYLTALKVGGSHKYGSLQSFLGKCQGHLGRAPTVSEARALIRISKLLSTRRVGARPKKS
jgi:hypothetical protein